jgi:hypothetical protein
MTVIMVSEDDHGTIAVAKNYACAIAFLVNDGWIYKGLEIIKEDDTITTIYEDLGGDYINVLLKWDIDTFARYFEGIFRLTVEEIYEEIL